MDRTSYFNEILPVGFALTQNAKESGPDTLKVYDGKENVKLKDITYIKRIAREKMRLNGAPIKYFPIDVDAVPDSTTNFDHDNILGDHTDLTLGPPIDMIATWTPQEYQIDLSKWGVIMPTGSDQQIFLHVDEITEKLGRKPQIGDIIETVRDTNRYRIGDVFFGHANLWENIFCMLTLGKINYDNYTSQLDQYDVLGESYKDTYTQLSEVLNVMDGSSTIFGNDEIIKQKKKTTDRSRPKKRSIDTGLDLMTMKL